MEKSIHVFCVPNGTRGERRCQIWLCAFPQMEGRISFSFPNFSRTAISFLISARYPTQHFILVYARNRPASINKKCGPAALRREPAHHVCQTCSKKRKLPAQESTRRHAWLTRSCCGRKNLFIDGPHSLLLFFLSPFLQGKEIRKQKQIQQVQIHRSDSLRSSSRCTRLSLAPRPLKNM